MQVLRITFWKFKEIYKTIFYIQASIGGGIPISYRSSRVKSTSLKWHLYLFIWPCSSNLLNACMLFGLLITTISSLFGNFFKIHRLFVATSTKRSGETLRGHWARGKLTIFSTICRPKKKYILIPKRSWAELKKAVVLMKRLPSRQNC